MTGEITKSFILKLLKNTQQDLTEVIYLITQYIYERKGTDVSINPQSCMFQMDLTNKAYKHIIEYYMNKFSIVKVMNKEGNLIAVI